MSIPTREAFRADLAEAGITLPDRDFEAALRIARGLAVATRRVRTYLDRESQDEPR